MRPTWFLFFFMFLALFVVGVEQPSLYRQIFAWASEHWVEIALLILFLTGLGYFLPSIRGPQE